MKRSRLQETSMEVTVGAFMFMVLLALGFFTIVLSRDNVFTKNYSFKVRFDNVKQLREGDNVFLRGVAVGKIKTMHLKEDGVHVMVNLDQPVALHTDYKVEILPSSVLGGRYLNIYEGSPDAPLVPKDEEFVGVPPVDLIDEATKTIESIKNALEEGEILENLKVTMAQVKDITTRLNNGEGTLGKLLTDDKVYEDLQKIASNLKDVSERIAVGKGTIGKLLSEDDQLYNNLSDASAAIKRIANEIDTGQGTIGRLLKDDALYDEALATLHDVRAAIDDLRETTPISTFTSVLLGAF